MSNNMAQSTNVVKELMGKKSYLLSKAEALAEIGMAETAQPLFLSTAAYEEQIAALLDTEGRELEAAVHRISAASCYKRADQFSRAVNLYRAALSGPLRADTRNDVLTMLKESLDRLTRQPIYSQTAPLPGAIPAG